MTTGHRCWLLSASVRSTFFVISQNTSGQVFLLVRALRNCCCNSYCNKFIALLQIPIADSKSPKTLTQSDRDVCNVMDQRNGSQLLGREKIENFVEGNNGATTQAKAC